MPRPLPTALALAVLALPASAAAQSAPLPPYTADVRWFYSGLGRDPVTAADLGLTPDRLPSRGLGMTATVNVYPLRRRRFTVGVGGTWLFARGSAQATDAEGKPVGPSIEQRLKRIGGAVSLNFGHRDGWSYLSAGAGQVGFRTYRSDLVPSESAPRQLGLDFGGGARWFTTDHLAVGFDLRFYLTPAEAATAAYPARSNIRLVVLSAGISFR